MYTMALGGCTLSSDNIVIKSPTDCRLYRYIQLRNGLCALLVHDPEIYSDGPLEPSKIAEKGEEEEDEEEEYEDEEDEDSEEDDDQEEEDDQDEGNESKEKIKTRASEKKVSVVFL
ncbi:unnamed protein product [Ilex paraguariensis]|uniref:Uncharacterized protein n=1 Tax=Ilex paraguariensis TaxID=185542 RepID=A0ABC8U9S4_9AQUA